MTTPTYTVPATATKSQTATVAHLAYCRPDTWTTTAVAADDSPRPHLRVTTIGPDGSSATYLVDRRGGFDVVGSTGPTSAAGCTAGCATTCTEDGSDKWCACPCHDDSCDDDDTGPTDDLREECACLLLAAYGLDAHDPDGADPQAVALLAQSDDAVRQMVDKLDRALREWAGVDADQCLWSAVCALEHHGIDPVEWVGRHPVYCSYENDW